MMHGCSKEDGWMSLAYMDVCAGCFCCHPDGQWYVDYLCWCMGCSLMNKFRKCWREDDLGGIYLTSSVTKLITFFGRWLLKWTAFVQCLSFCYPVLPSTYLGYLVLMRAKYRGMLMSHSINTTSDFDILSKEICRVGIVRVLYKT